LFLWNIAEIRKEMHAFRANHPLVPGEEKAKKKKKSKKQREKEKEEEKTLPVTPAPAFGGVGGESSFMAGVNMENLLAGPSGLSSSDGRIITRAPSQPGQPATTVTAMVPTVRQQPPRPTRGFKQPRVTMQSLPIKDNVYIEYRQSIGNILIHIYTLNH
jgi:hypothetical protein